MSKKFADGLFAAAMAVTLSGCAVIPQLDIQSPVTVANIVDRIQCEAYRATQRYPQLKRDRWVGVADLYLQVDDSAGLSPSLAYVDPAVQLVVGASGTLKRARQRVYNESLRLELAKLDGKTCNKVLVDYDLTGVLGIEETLSIASQSFDKEDNVAFADKEAVGQTLQFVLTKNVSGGPTWTLTHFIGPGPLAGAERIDTHKLIVSFAPGAPLRKVVVTTPDGQKKTVFAPTSGGGAAAASFNNQKLLLQSLPSIQFLGR
ncbi:hypothetical protein ML401_20645 [Bradyrhizobium sp. 62B]|uniref:hypothetical protein n=1 Tax=Bradyrhizobium sp. 62B TaxID=2898442 RepID=UPI002557D0E8|nr:hypothetical protein ML401_20645 [Bradyrhizobium sp. 62B]